MKRVTAILLLLATALSLCACGSVGGRKVPSDWVIMPNDEAKALYHSVDFTADNIGDYLTYTQSKEEIYNDWGELTRVHFNNGIMIPAKNFIQYQTPDDEFLMDITLSYKSYGAKLDPVTLEEIGVIEDTVRQSENFRTVSSMHLNSYLDREAYVVDYGKDGKPVVNEDGELIVTKKIITGWKVERVRGHAEWIADIPDKYIMNTDDYSPHSSMLDGAYVKFIVIEGEDYYYCYESYNNDDSYQTNAFAIRGNSGFCMGNCISFVRGREGY